MADDPLEELETLQTCQEAIVTLLIPDVDLDARGRDRLGVLLNYLNRQQERALDRLRNSKPIMRIA